MVNIYAAKFSTTLCIVLLVYIYVCIFFMIGTVIAGCVVRVAERRGAHWILLVRPDGRRPLGRPRYRWKDNMRMNLQGM